MKKILSLIISLILIVVCFTACSTSPVYYDSNDDAYADLGKYISVSQYKGVEFPRSSAEIVEEIQSKYHSDMETYHLSETQVLEKDAKVQKGDTVKIDYTGKKDGVAFSGGTAKDQNLTIGSGKFIDGFEDGLIGVEVGKTVDLNLTFPNPYPNNPDLAGKAVVFTVTVKSITRNSYPALSEVGEIVAREMGFDSLADYEKAVIDSIKNEYIWTKKIVELSTVVTYPEKELEKNKQYFLKQYTNLIATYGEETVNNRALENAKERTKEELVGYYIARKENIVVAEDEVVESATKTYGADYTDEELEFTRLSLTMKKVIKFCVDNAVVK